MAVQAIFKVQKGDAASLARVAKVFDAPLAVDLGQQVADARPAEQREQHVDGVRAIGLDAGRVGHRLSAQQRAYRTFLDQPPRGSVLRGIVALVADRQHRAGRATSTQHAVRLVQVHGHRLFADDALDAAFRSRHRHDEEDKIHGNNAGAGAPLHHNTRGRVCAEQSDTITVNGGSGCGGTGVAYYHPGLCE